MLFLIVYYAMLSTIFVCLFHILAEYWVKGNDKLEYYHHSFCPVVVKD